MTAVENTKFSVIRVDKKNHTFVKGEFNFNRGMFTTGIRTLFNPTGLLKNKETNEKRGTKKESAQSCSSFDI